MHIYALSPAVVSISTHRSGQLCSSFLSEKCVTHIILLTADIITTAIADQISLQARDHIKWALCFPGQYLSAPAQLQQEITRLTTFLLPT